MQQNTPQVSIRENLRKKKKMKGYILYTSITVRRGKKRTSTHSCVTEESSDNNRHTLVGAHLATIKETEELDECSAKKCAGQSNDRKKEH